jgi:SAM-dependent methyltransferase
MLSSKSALERLIANTVIIGRVLTKEPLTILTWLRKRGKERYIFMQKTRYRWLANASHYEPEKRVDLVAGSYDEQNNWADYDLFLMKYVDDSYEAKIALDFACGPGRNIIKYHGRFKRIDGADISPENLTNARKNLAHAGIPEPRLFVTGGDDVGETEAGYYDFIFSTIAIQHICVHEVRFGIFRAMFQALKPGGRISIQMGFGRESPHTVGYFENNYHAINTNRRCDTRVEDPSQIQGDLTKIGFVGFEHWIRPVGPGDIHPNWIFFTATKPVTTAPI